MSQPHAEPEAEFRVPSQFPRCRRSLCRQAPVADMRRTRHNWRGDPGTPREYGVWWAYCADHLREHNREVRDGRVWWLGVPEHEHEHEHEPEPSP